MCTVMKLDLQREEWTKLPQYSAEYFAMTSLENQLVLVGGYDPVTRKKNQSDWSALHLGQWTHPYPPMKLLVTLQQLSLSTTTSL